jgi:hypothetical protein
MKMFEVTNSNTVAGDIQFRGRAGGTACIAGLILYVGTALKGQGRYQHNWYV